MAAAKGEGATNEHVQNNTNTTPLEDHNEQQSERHGSDGDNPFYPSIVDEESVDTSVSEPPNTLRDRLSRVVRWPWKTPKSVYQFTGDAKKDQLIKSLDQYTVGYPKVAAFENADPSFLIYRKFGWLHNRLLLYLQDELAELEFKLDQLDKATFSDDEDIKLSSRRDDWAGPSKRRDLVRQIAQKLEEYDMVAQQFIFRTKEQKIVTGDEDVSLFDPHRLDIFLRVVLTILAAILLLVPVLILFTLQPTSADEVRRKGKHQVLTIFLFTMMFSASCSVFTKARRQEVFTATAAYCAVLVVFLGNTLNDLGGGR
ncbi:MAG: hypothetical protein Q9171_005113 [Xanthocarpia ochracea]